MSEIIINGTQLSAAETFFFLMLIVAPWIHGAINLIQMAVSSLIKPAFRYFARK